MLNQREQPIYASTLSPFPEGWFFVATRKDILKSKLIRKTWMGEEIIVWADEGGNVCVADAFCPHLGSDLGPEAGGKVCGGRLVCPFHGFQYDATGQCVDTPNADPPRTAKLKVFPTQELCGLIFAWNGIEGRPPQWHLPDQEPEMAGWTGFRINTLTFRAHAQDTTENAVDMAHFYYVHGYGSVKRIGKVIFDGPYMQSDFDFTRDIKAFGRTLITMDISAKTEVYGLGYSLVKFRDRSIGIDMRMWVLNTPIDGENVELTLVSHVKELRNPKRKIAGMAFLPVRFRAPIISWFTAKTEVGEVLTDVRIWSRKRYVSRPRLARSDGEIMPFRAYCAQFYPNPAKPAETRPLSAAGSVE